MRFQALQKFDLLPPFFLSDLSDGVELEEEKKKKKQSDSTRPIRFPLEKVKTVNALTKISSFQEASADVTKKGNVNPVLKFNLTKT